MVAIEWAHLSPSEIASATIINTSVRPYSAFYHRLRPQNYLQLMQLIALTPAQREAIILQLTSNRFSEATLKEWIDFQAQYPISPANILRQLWAAASYRAPTTQPSVPMQLLSSQLDRLVNNKCSLALAKHWNLPHFIHPNAGHDLALDDPEWLIRHLATAYRKIN
jgi:pimeloyl-ACP methyl ester carboxylesterase